MTLSRKQKGDIAEAEARIHFIKEGYEVYAPTTDNTKYDLLVCKDGVISRVSVKYCSTAYTSGNWKVSLANVSRRANNSIQKDLFDSSMFDLIAVYIGPEDRLAVLPATDATPNILTVPKMEV